MSERATHCWKSELDWIEETYGFPSDQWCDYMSREVKATCMLPDGHAGPHEFVPDSEIVLTFWNEYRAAELRAIIEQATEQAREQP